MLTELSGRTIAGRFDLLALLGSGGMGAVYRAHDRELDDLVALKVMRSQYAQRPELLDRFRREVKLARRVTHRNVARTFELGHEGDLFYCTMELIPGHSLGTLLSRRAPLLQHEAITITHALCEALTAAHAVGVIHRDIKPDNVLVSDDGRIVLADFGIAALAGELLDVAGTPPYMAPEQLRGAAPSPATDVYAVGCLLHEMLTGTRVFVGSTADIRVEKERRPHLALPAGFDPDLAKTVERATMRNETDRIATAEELGRLVAPRTSRATTQVDATGIISIGDKTKTYELRTIIVLPPRGDTQVLHIATGVHEALLRRLAELPRIRVRPRVKVEADHDATLVVKMLVAEDLEVAITRRDGRESLLRVPPAIGEIDAIAAASVRAIELALAEAQSAEDSEATELYLRARQAVRHSPDMDALMRARGLLEKAARLRPDDPRITATLASTTIRLTIVPAQVSEQAHERARTLVERALATAPHVVDAHLAAAHFAWMTRDAATAARHFRRAIACEPYSAEAHEQLGRMLLEAGFIELGMSRIDEAMAMAPALGGVQWERARAWHLDGRREDAWREANALVAIGSTRVMQLLRMAWWERDLERSAFWRAEVERLELTFDPVLQPQVFAAVHDGMWPALRDAMLSYVTEPVHSRRLAALLAQVVAEIAGLVGDREACLESVEHALDAGLYDRHWLERCPLLDDIRGLPRYARLHRIVVDRADQILDALYGDEAAPETAKTVVI